MIIKELKFNNFKLFRENSYIFDSGINIICGDNATGKTSIVDGIHFVMLLRSTNNLRATELITYRCDEMSVFGLFETKKGKKTALVLNSNKVRKMAQNDVEIKRTADYVDFSSVVSFSNKDIINLQLSPASRRKMIDVVLCQIDKGYLISLNEYKKIIKDKNSLLKLEEEKTNFSLLNIYTNKQFELAMIIQKKRKQFIDLLNEHISSIYNYISSSNETAKINYICNYNETNFFEKCKSDLQYKSCTVGAHRDDFAFMIDGKNVSMYASQGQIKTLAISFKMACVSLIRTLKEEPIVLLDDVFGELDKDRQNQLINLLLEQKNQVFITTPSLSDIEKTLVDSANIIYLEKTNN